MPSLREIRGHIRSVAGIAQVIHAMEAVSSVTTHRLQERVDNSLAYAESSWRMLARLSAVDDPAVGASVVFDTHRPGDRTCLLLIGSNRGMAGGYDQNVIRAALEYSAGVRDGVELITIGSVGREALLHRGMAVSADWSQLDEHVQMDDLSPIAGYLMRGFREHLFDRAAIAYTQYHGRVRLKPTIRVLLPVALPERPKPRQYYFEPGATALIEALLPKVVQSTVYVALLESLAAENMARAVAMRSAGKNARELADSLRLSYNKSRQEAITSEMNEVSSALSLGPGS